MLIFGNGTGLIIYDLADSRVEGLVDMQAICSGYYNTDTIRTHVLVQDDRLIVYNTKSNGGNLTENAGDDSENTEEAPEPWGYYHVFDLSKTTNDAALMDCIESGDDKDKINGFIEAGSAYEHEHLLDAFDNMAYLQSDEMDDIVGYGITAKMHLFPEQMKMCFPKTFWSAAAKMPMRMSFAPRQTGRELNLYLLSSTSASQMP